MTGIRGVLGIFGVGLSTSLSGISVPRSVSSSTTSLSDSGKKSLPILSKFVIAGGVDLLVPTGCLNIPPINWTVVLFLLGFLFASSHIPDEKSKLPSSIAAISLSKSSSFCSVEQSVHLTCIFSHCSSGPEHEIPSKLKILLITS